MIPYQFTGIGPKWNATGLIANKFVTINFSLQLHINNRLFHHSEQAYRPDDVKIPQLH